jgi:DNA-binding MarR family transcriptional regulator
MTDNPDRGRTMLRAVSRMHRLQIDELGKLEIELTMRQFHILERISAGHTSLSELSRLSHRSLPSTSESVDGLIRRKLLTRRVLATDRRSVVLGLTKRGTQALEAGTELLNEMGETFFVSLSATKQNVLDQVSRQMFDFAGSRLWPEPDSGKE